MKPDYISSDGMVTLYRADCRKVLPRISADVLISDPPYGIGLRNGDVDGHRSERWDSIEGDHNQDAGIAAINWADEAGLPIVVFASPWKPWPGEWRNLIVWDKGGAVGGGGDISTCLKRTWELIQVRNNRSLIGGRAESVWREAICPQDTALHIAQKPVALMVRLIETFAGFGTIVLDPFMGSGTTGVVCVRQGRSFIGIEIDEEYFKIAVKRIEQAFEDNALFDPTPPAQATQLELLPRQHGGRDRET